VAKGTRIEAQTINGCCSGRWTFGFLPHRGELAAFWAHITPQKAKVCGSPRNRLPVGIEQVQIAGADGHASSPAIGPSGILARDPRLDICPHRARLRAAQPLRPCACATANGAERLFGFRYRIEMFRPAPKRVYGYYVFPIPAKARSIIARFDMKAHRDRDTVVVRPFGQKRARVGVKGKQVAFEAENCPLLPTRRRHHITFRDGLAALNDRFRLNALALKPECALTITICKHFVDVFAFPCK